MSKVNSKSRRVYGCIFYEGVVALAQPTFKSVFDITLDAQTRLLQKK